VYIPTGDFRGTELAPNLEYQFKGAKVSTNQWGMRDQHYELKKSENTTRIALLGASYVFGSGVSNTETFESVLEEMLNDKRDSGYGIEILNFATSGRTAVRQTAILEYKVFPFSPDIVLYIGHKDDARRVAASVAKRVIYDFDILFPGLRSIVEKANVNKDMDLETIENRLNPYGREILQWAYGRIVKESRKRGIWPVYILLPMTYERLKKAEIEEDINMARSAGFTTIDLSDVYNLQDPESLYIAQWDKHPNAKGHRLIAEHLYRVFTESENQIFMQPPGDQLLISEQQDQSKP
jgi:lysophospholipase L1-like esterase